MTCSTWCVSADHFHIDRDPPTSLGRGRLSGQAPVVSKLTALGALQHRHESHNNQETTFDFTEANYERVRLLLMSHPRRLAQSSW